MIFLYFKKKYSVLHLYTKHKLSRHICSTAKFRNWKNAEKYIWQKCKKCICPTEANF